MSNNQFKCLFHEKVDSQIDSLNNGYKELREVNKRQWEQIGARPTTKVLLTIATIVSGILGGLLLIIYLQGAEATQALIKLNGQVSSVEKTIEKLERVGR